MISLVGIRHRLSRMKVRGLEQNPELVLRQALRLCGGTVTQLHIEATGFRLFVDTQEDVKASMAMRIPEPTSHITFVKY